MNEVLVVGNVSWDTSHYPDGRSYSFVGGGALKVSLAAAQCDTAAAPAAVVDRQMYDALVAMNLPPAFSMRFVKLVPDYRTPRFDFSLDSQGDVHRMEMHMPDGRELTVNALSAVAQSNSHVHICCRDPLLSADVACAVANSGRAFSIDFISSSIRSHITQLGPLLSSAILIFANKSELASVADILAQRSIGLVVCTSGRDGASILRSGEVVASARPQGAQSAIIETTGAGDVLCGSFLGRFLKGMPVERALQEAVDCASDSVRHPQSLLSPADEKKRG